jgi:hypothetical protein
MYILAFYFSKFDVRAINQLGYSSFKDAREKLAEIFSFNANSLKNRRDDFDVLTGSHRTGWVSRPSTNIVQETYRYFKSFSFDELTALVQSFIENAEDSSNVTLHMVAMSPSLKEINGDLTESEIEQIINYEDITSDLLIISGNVPRRRYRRSIIDQLKKLYHYQCQICGHSFENIYNASCTEAHHIEFFANTRINNAKNIIILCPNHHRIIHLLNPVFDRHTLTWAYPNGLVELVQHNIHL